MAPEKQEEHDIIDGATPELEEYYAIDGAMPEQQQEYDILDGTTLEKP